ncbi:hypothetical protein TNCV_4190971 [Trichonephila clavipes]|nr:hypothetical protein TNCV_4190971 [Trichonephila clavipes]
MSETRTDVASTPVSTLFSLDPICFDVANATKHLDSITTCSECEEFIDMIEEYIENVKKTVGVLDDVQKLRLISEVQGLALKATRKSIRLQNREFKDYIEELKRLNEHKFPTTPSPSKAKRAHKSAPRLLFQARQGRNNAPASESDPATQHPLPPP